MADDNINRHQRAGLIAQDVAIMRIRHEHARRGMKVKRHGFRQFDFSRAALSAVRSEARSTRSHCRRASADEIRR